MKFLKTNTSSESEITSGRINLESNERDIHKIE